MSKDDRDKRLADALRANLRRRKAQARAALETGEPPVDAADTQPSPTSPRT